MSTTMHDTHCHIFSEYVLKLKGTSSFQSSFYYRFREYLNQIYLIETDISVTSYKKKLQPDGKTTLFSIWYQEPFQDQYGELYYAVPNMQTFYSLSASNR